MTTQQQWRHLPVAARPIAAAAQAAVAATRKHDDEALGSAVAALAALDPAQVGLILGTCVRLLLEHRHPDGLTGDEVRAVLVAAVRDGADPEVTLVLLAGALGLDHEVEAAPAPATLARDAVLLLTGQLGEQPVEPWLEAALSEIERAQLND
jgi:hypothetical protein